MVSGNREMVLIMAGLQDWRMANKGVTALSYKTPEKDGKHMKNMHKQACRSSCCCRCYTVFIHRLHHLVFDRNKTHLVNFRTRGVPITF